MLPVRQEIQVKRDRFAIQHYEREWEPAFTFRAPPLPPIHSEPGWHAGNQTWHHHLIVALTGDPGNYLCHLTSSLKCSRNQLCRVRIRTPARQQLRKAHVTDADRVGGRCRPGGQQRAGQGQEQGEPRRAVDHERPLEL